VVGGGLAVFVASLALYPLLTVAFFPHSDAGQFVINLKMPSGTRIDRTEQLLQQVESVVRSIVTPADLAMVVDNIGVTPGFSSIYTSNSGPHTATIQVELKASHRVGSYEYMDRIRARLASDLPEVSAFLQPGGLQDAILNRGLPAPIDVQISGSDLETIHAAARDLAARIRPLPHVSDAFIPTDLDYPSLQLNVNRQHAAELGLNQREVVTNVITALTSNGMIAPSYWIDPKSGNDYMLTVQYPESEVKNIEDLKSIPLHAGGDRLTTLDAVASVGRVSSPTEVDHYQIQRVADIFVTPTSEDLGAVSTAIERVIAQTRLAPGVRVRLRGMVDAMRTSFASFGLGLLLAVLLLYLVLVPPFRSFSTPLLVLLAVPLGLTGAMATLLVSGTTLNVMSLMGMVTLVGVAVSNSILIMDYVERERRGGRGIADVVIAACRTRLRPVLLTSVATVIGLVPLVMKLGTGGEMYVPLALVVIGGLLFSFVSTLIMVPAACVLVYR
jgi:multidrug efflux pump subunit AcrB